MLLCVTFLCACKLQPAVQLINAPTVFKQTNITQAHKRETGLRFLVSTNVYAEGSSFSGRFERLSGRYHHLPGDRKSYLLYTNDSKFAPALPVDWAKSTSDVYAAHAAQSPYLSPPANPHTLTGAVSQICVPHW